jgi:hypothetical protein
MEVGFTGDERCLLLLAVTDIVLTTIYYPKVICNPQIQNSTKLNIKEMVHSRHQLAMMKIFGSRYSGLNLEYK